MLKRTFFFPGAVHYSETCWTLLRILILENATLPYWAIKCALSTNMLDTFAHPDLRIGNQHIVVLVSSISCGLYDTTVLRMRNVPQELPFIQQKVLWYNRIF